jgi:hypothetical protein
MQDAFGVERGDISKGLFKPAAGIKMGGWMTRHFPKATTSGKRQLGMNASPSLPSLERSAEKARKVSEDASRFSGTRKYRKKAARASFKADRALSRAQRETAIGAAAKEARASKYRPIGAPGYQPDAASWSNAAKTGARAKKTKAWRTDASRQQRVGEWSTKLDQAARGTVTARGAQVSGRQDQLNRTKSIYDRVRGA